MNILTQMKDQLHYLSLNNPDNMYNAKYLEREGIIMSVMTTTHKDGSFYRSAYWQIGPNHQTEYIGSQYNDDNSRVFPFGDFPKKLLQDVLWNVGLGGKSLQ